MVWIQGVGGQRIGVGGANARVRVFECGKSSPAALAHKEDVNTVCCVDLVDDVGGVPLVWCKRYCLCKIACTLDKSTQFEGVGDVGEFPPKKKQ